MHTPTTQIPPPRRGVFRGTRVVFLRMELEQQTLSSHFQDIERVYNHSISQGFANEEERIQLIQSLISLLSHIQRNGIFSSNEEIDDISTQNLKYKFALYYLGACYRQCSDQTIRAAQLLKSRETMLQFLTDCQQIGVLDEEEKKFLRNYEDEEKRIVATPQDRRQQKIEKYKKQKAIKERIQSLQRLLHITKDDDEVDHEDEIRELAVIQLKYYAQECVDEIPMIDQELPLLEMRDLEQLAAQDRREKERQNGEASSPASLDIRRPPQRGEGPGISIVTMNKVGDEIITTRDVFRANVFGSSIAPPTMTLEEFADLEIQGAREREEREKAAAASQENASGKRYSHLLAEGLEDDEELVDQSAKHDQAWDDWKDHNPKGSGNKLGKRF